MRRNRRISLFLAVLVALAGAWLAVSFLRSPGDELGPEPRPGEEAGLAPERAGAPLRERGLAPAPRTPAEASTTKPSAPGQTPSEGAALPLPELEASDAFVREAAASLADHPGLARWLLIDGIARRFVVTVDNIAEGHSPRRHLRFLTPRGSYLVLGDEYADASVLIDPGSYRRYDAFVGAIEALDPQDCARLFGTLRPLLQLAYEELGYPGASFDRRLEEAAFELLSTPVLTGQPQLLPRVKRFEYADPELENLSDAQKHLLRMGPRNVERLQRKLRELSAAIDPSWTPPPRQVYRPRGPAQTG